MIITPHKYPYAINEDGLPIHIDKISQENRRQSRYYCYGCGAELFPVLGEKREHHFRHEKDAICDPNKYLHEFAKATIKKRFDESDKFIVKYNATHICRNYNNCQFSKNDWQECMHDGLYELDLKEFYNTCTLEKGYYAELPVGNRKYIADIILTNSQKPQQPPTTIEIWVTHECTEDKKQNGGRIIEIKVSCEEDALREIIEKEYDTLPIRFFNFKNPIEKEPTRKFKHVKLLPGIKGKVIVTDETLCEEGLIYDPKGENEVVISMTNINPDYLELFYAAKCCEKGIAFPKFDLCQHSMVVNYYGQKRLRCAMNFDKCPCEKSFKYDAQKGEIILKQIKKIPYWEQSK